ncbi:hypothetical protein WN943_014368 [Citrus x changshan-huyou]
MALGKRIGTSYSPKVDRGDIPVSIGGLKDLATLSLARNQFYGLVPKSFGSLIRLESLDLPSNNLSAEIPKSMEALSYLKQLNVSHNRLEGGIPIKGPFKNISAQSFFENYALCGPLGLQVPPCKEDNSKGSKNATLLLERAFRSLDSECEVLWNVRHQDLTKITSSCCNPDSKVLMLEFMLNGSLEKWLCSHNYFLDILERLNIMIDVRLALEYLHHDHSSAPVIHSDLKLATFSWMKIWWHIKNPTNEMFTGEISLRDRVRESLPCALSDAADANLIRVKFLDDAAASS